jgi:ubiquinone biosynthesis protein COQ9
MLWWDDVLYQTNTLRFLNAACSAVNTNFIVFGLTRRMLDHMIYQSRDKHTDYYTTDVVFANKNLLSYYFI